MRKREEPKFTVTYTESNLSEKEKKINYEKFLKHLVKVVKEQEELENKKAN